MSEQTKAQRELVETVGQLMSLRLELTAVIQELMNDPQFPNNASWIARMLVHEYEIRRRNDGKA